MKNVRVIVFTFMALLISAGIFALTFYQQTGETRAVTNQPTAYIEATHMNVGFKVGGRIAEVLVQEGDRVAKGQVLARLQNQEIQAKVAQAEAAVAAAKAKETQGNHAVAVTNQTTIEQAAQARAAVQAAEAHLEALKNGARQEDRMKAEIQLEATKEGYRLAEENMKRMNELFEQGVIPQVKVDETYLSLQKAKAEYEAAVQQVELVKNGARPEELKAAHAQVEQAKAALAIAEAGRGQVQLKRDDVSLAGASVMQAEASLLEAKTYSDYTELIAPAEGLITGQSAQLGELVGSGFPVFTLQAESDRWAYFYFPETDIGELHIGQKVTLKLVATGDIVQGKIAVLKPAADFAIQKSTGQMGETDIRSFGLKVVLEGTPSSFHPGMTIQWVDKGANTP
ncbi:HlyD family efflux transporter periplasmic adaptor subunit [Ammoniphilus sp. CFH 90114]|nr:HlyD family efflux transporter periplasmic adaptor subunit [Ammoniphilus sp. CFH 90114]